MEFFITGGNQEHVFNMVTIRNPTTYGSLRLFSPLDYEVTRDYILQVSASDHGTSSDPGVVTITVSLQVLRY